jgi:hypothetical protein
LRTASINPADVEVGLINVVVQPIIGTTTEGGGKVLAFHRAVQCLFQPHALEV